MTLSECQVQLGGIPSENVAVLSLTATATTTLQGSSPGPGASNNQPLTSVLGPLDPSLTSRSTVPPRLTQPTYPISAPALAPTLPSSTRVELKTSSPAASLSGLPSLQPSDGVHTTIRAGQISSADLAVVDQSHEAKSTAPGEPQLPGPGAEIVVPDEFQQVEASSSPPLAGLLLVDVSGKEATKNPASQSRRRPRLPQHRVALPEDKSYHWRRQQRILLLAYPPCPFPVYRRRKSTIA